MPIKSKIQSAKLQIIKNPKLKSQKYKQNTVHKIQNTNRYREFEARTTEFAKRIIRLCKELPNDRINNPLVKQIIRSSGSVGANYREANEALGKKDFVHRLRIARKEAKETEHWLELIGEADPVFKERMKNLFQEVGEIRNIISAIIEKAKQA